MRILIVEDDPDIASLLQRNFLAEGHAADHADSGERALEMVRDHTYQAMIMDVMLPGRSGLDVCRALRKQSHAATIIMLSARDTVADRIEGLSAGADDYVVKPFAFEELYARLNAQQRRRTQENPQSDGDIVRCGAITYEPQLREMSLGSRRVALTEREADLLLYFMRNEGATVSREAIFDALWQEQGGISVNVVDVYIGYLRRKLAGLSPETRNALRTIRGTGFMFVAVATPGNAKT